MVVMFYRQGERWNRIPVHRLLNLFSHYTRIGYAHIGWMFTGHMSFVMDDMFYNIMKNGSCREAQEVNITWAIIAVNSRNWYDIIALQFFAEIIVQII